MGHLGSQELAMGLVNGCMFALEGISVDPDQALGFHLHFSLRSLTSGVE